MNVLVLGGTRFIGPHVVRQLVAAGHETALFNRGQSRPDISLPQGVRIIRGDRRRLADYRESFRSFAPDVVIDLFPYTEAEAQAVMTVFDGIAGRLVAVSSCDVYRAFGRVNGLEDGPVEEGPIREDSPLRTRLYPYRGIREDLPDYEKILVERVVTGHPHLPGTMLRLPMVYGPGDYRHRLYPYLKRMLDGRRKRYAGPSPGNRSIPRPTCRRACLTTRQKMSCWPGWGCGRNMESLPSARHRLCPDPGLPAWLIGAVMRGAKPSLAAFPRA
ncbi:NAD-dependent epimerase/dehydratase family protein [Brevibacillus sp. LEMMJ03]|uniref:NAD-dependent epimerase/dehydratase family protein n=1 Tax=Brevibacillus sp. LEMMJ03 TaxID=2595056 RepID=UPI001181116A|nr:NAD-dependent epimerase/dehydratase family protein [Brevibacillus sp. LEMMJ03]TRY24136.1 NAD-dependent epimerase/dehydratase family protein [Brevibacillus sp. LEMMJ03]